MIYTGTAAERKLKQLGLDATTIREILLYGAAERATYTEYDARGAGEYARWSRHVRRASELLVPREWKRIDPDGQPTLVHPSRKWCLIVTSGNSATGTVWATPSTKNPKGRSIREAVSNNAELALIRPQDIEPTLEGLRQTWMLMTHANTQGKVQWEVSYPKEMVGEYVTDFQDRVFLEPIDPDEPASDGGEEPPDYGFTISRK